MKKVFFILIPAVILSLLSCSPKKPAEEKKSAIDTIPTMVMQIQKCTRLYTAEGIRKPDPRLFEIALDRLGLQPQETMVVGDSLKNDILPAHSLGCATAWLQGEGWNNDQHEPPAETHVITSLDQLLQLA